MAPENFEGIAGVGEVSVPFPLMNRVKSQLPRSFAKPPRGVVGCPIDWAGSLTKAGKESILSQRNAYKSDCELRLQVMRIECTVATFPPKTEGTYLRGE